MNTNDLQALILKLLLLYVNLKAPIISKQIRKRNSEKLSMPSGSLIMIWNVFLTGSQLQSRIEKSCNNKLGQGEI